MPKDNFFKLDQEKRDRIINAAYDEFITYKSNYKKASIKRIVKEADISIGSFYEYFDDKDDLFLFLINNIADKKQKYVFNEKDNIKDIFLKILKISEDNSILDDREKELVVFREFKKEFSDKYQINIFPVQDGKILNENYYNIKRIIREEIKKIIL